MSEQFMTNTKEERGEDDLIGLLKAMALAAVVALTIRSFLFEPFSIPSGSLLPTLQIGDYLFVEKYAYGYSRYSFPAEIFPFSGRILGKDPARGDIAVFRQPKKTGIDYIKRIIGLPGDKVQVKGGILRVNGKAVMRDYRDAEPVGDEDRLALYKRYIETLPNGVQHYIYELSDDEHFDNTPVYTVPPGYYFAMGDNRDSSLDSRAQDEVGLIPAENLIGRAWFIFFSIDGSLQARCSKEKPPFLQKVACMARQLPASIRFERLFKSVNRL